MLQLQHSLPFHHSKTNAASPKQENVLAVDSESYWEQNGGLAVFGYPITAPTNEVNASGGTFLTQWFERNRFELHPENAAPYDVLLGRLGDDRLKQQGRNWFTFPKGQQNGSCLWFVETGHGVCEPFKSYWERNGLQDPALSAYGRSLALFGLPLSEPAVETNASGDSVVTQWFERARFEFHPSNSPSSQVLLGLLGNEVRGGPSQPAPRPQPQPTQPPTAPNQCADAPQPVSARVRTSNCVTVGTYVSFDIYGFQPNEPIGFWLTTPDGRRAGTEETANIGPSDRVNGLEFDTSGLQLGVWYWVFQGTNGGHQSIVYIKVIGSGSTPPPPPTAPQSTTPPQPTQRPQPSATPRPAPSPTSPPARNCDPSYPTVYIPLPPPDLDCGDIPHRNFTVRQPDPHRFEGDKDGVGCET